MNGFFIATTITLIIGIFVIIKIMEKGIPELLTRKKKEWEEEQNKRKKIQQYKKIEDDKIEKVTKEIKKEIFEKNRKIRSKKIYKSNIQKGKDYEKFIANYFKEKGYKVKEHGLLNGKKDKGIDIIIMKNKIITLIQCKNWKADSKRKINHIRIKEFLGNCSTFLTKYKEEGKGYEIKKLYIVSNDILDNSAKKFILNNQEIVKYKIIPYLNKEE